MKPLKDLSPTILLLIIVLIVILLRLPLAASLWLDETISFWISKDSLAETAARAMRYQGQSPLYFLLLSVWQHLIGSRELILRIPSLYAWIGSAIVLYRLATRLLSAEAALASLLLFLCCTPIQIAATSARPYALALFSSLCSVSFFLGWIESKSRHEFAAALTFAALAFYFHYLFGAVIAFEALIFLLARSKRPSLSSILIFLAAGSIFFIPGLLQLLSLSTKGSLYNLSAANPSTLIISWPQPNLLVLLASALAAAVLIKRASFSILGLPAKFYLCAILLWAIFPPLFLLALSALVKSELTLERYYLWYAPGFCLALSLGIELISSLEARRFGVLFLAMMCLIAECERSWKIEDWRGAIAAVREQYANRSVAPNTPLLFSSGLVESQNIAWLEEPQNFDYLAAPFSYYSLPTKPLLLPIDPLPPAAARYISQKLSPLLSNYSASLLLSPGWKFKDSIGEDFRIWERYNALLGSKGPGSKLGDFSLIYAAKFIN